MPLDDIVLDDFTYQMRVETKVGDLKKSLQDDGQLEPVHLIGAAPPFRIVDGFRRCAAAKALGWADVQAFVHEKLDDECAFKLAFLHNVVRRNLRPIDRANAIRLVQKRGMKLHEAANHLNLSEKQVRRYLALLKLSRAVQDAIDEHSFTMAHALVLTEFEVGNVEQVVAEVKARSMSVPQLRKLVRASLGQAKRGRGRPRQLVAREGDRLLFHGVFSLTAPQAERERLAERLIELVALLQRPRVGSSGRSRAAQGEGTQHG